MRERSRAGLINEVRLKPDTTGTVKFAWGGKRARRENFLTCFDLLVFDAALDRERRRGSQGYATPAQARAFLEMSRTLRLDRDTAPAVNPIAQSYFREIEATPPPDAEIVDVLRDAGIVPPRSRALLEGPDGDAPRLAPLQTRMAFVLDHDEAAHARRTGELAYLANVMTAGCSIQGRPFTEQEAFDAAVAICNCGLENWPAQWRSPVPLPSGAEEGAELPEDFLVDRDLVSVFQVGWAVLHRDVSMAAAEELIAILGDAAAADRDLRQDLDQLRAALTRAWREGAPWRARGTLDVIATLDGPAWAALTALLGECPVIHAGVRASRGTRAVSATAFELIAGNDQIAAVREFLRSLPEILGLARD
jgi:hypothetical protein